MVWADQFVQLQVQGFGITILRVLNEEYDKERDDCGACINDELPGVREVKERPARSPYNQHYHCSQKHIRMPNHLRGLAGKAAEPEVDAAGLPDLRMGLKVWFAIVSGHGCN